MRIAADKIRKAVTRLVLHNLDEYQHITLGLLVGTYDAQTDTWEVDQENGRKIEMLSGPHYLTILKINKIQNE